jgi:methylenetetrahydrofolate reductase (NADPH)
LCAITGPWVKGSCLHRIAIASPAEHRIEPRFEVLPFGTSEEQAARLTAPVRLTVTTSPRHGVDHSLEHAVRLRRLGHRVTFHVAARMVRGSAHLDEILQRAAEAGIDDLLVIGGDAAEPLGPYTSAGELLEVLAGHPLRPAAVGIGGYPEGHPLIEQDALDAALQHKAPLASYIVTQLCFDADVLLSWLERLRARGIELPVYVGAPGPIDRRRLLDISLRIGVGPSLRFVRKQRGLTQLFRSPVDSAARLYDEIAPRLHDPRWGMSSFHFFTFNELEATWTWQLDRRSRLLDASEKREVDAVR